VLMQMHILEMVLINKLCMHIKSSLPRIKCDEFWESSILIRSGPSEVSSKCFSCQKQEYAQIKFTLI
jgi:hypothetical protein